MSADAPFVARRDPQFHLTMCFRAAAGALVSQVKFYRLRRSRATASERAMVRVNPQY